MSNRKMETSVSPEFSGLRLDLYLSRRFTYLSRNRWQALIKSGEVLLNGITAKYSKKVSRGDEIIFSPPSNNEPEVDPSFQIVFEDEYYLGVSKSGNLPVHPSGAYFNNTLTEILEMKYGKKFYPMHRIDRETSGLVMLGKKSDYASKFQTGFDNVRKSYLAIVNGVTRNRDFTVDVPMGPDPKSRVRKKRMAHSTAAERACTRFELLGCDGERSLIRAFPVTGRTHQIRVHLEYLGIPIAGDLLYGGDETLFLKLVEEGDSLELRERAGFARCALHSESLSFEHPYTGEDVCVSAPVPDDMYGAVKSFEDAGV